MKKREIHTIVYDLDGTLIDSAPDIQEALNVVMTEYHGEKINLSETKGLIGGGVKELLRQGLETTDEKHIEKARLRFMQYYLERFAVHTRLYPGVEDVLTFFKSKNQVLLTNKPIEITVKIIKALHIERFFDLVIGAGSTPYVKPAPELVNEIWKILPTPANKTVVVGDGETDIQLGHRAHIMTVAVNYGYRTAQQLEKECPNIIIDNLSDLIKYIE